MLSIMDFGSFAPGFQFSAVASRVLTVVRAVARLCQTSGDKAEKQEVPSGATAAQAPPSLVAAGLGKPSLTLVSALHPLNCV